MNTHQIMTRELRSGLAAAPLRGEYGAVAALLDRYYEGLYYGNTELLRQVFHPAATYATAAGGELLRLDLDGYLPVVAKRESPASLGERYGFELESILFAGPTVALAKMRSTMLGKRFVDLLSLLKVDGEWRILAKVFHYDIDVPVRGD
ncbi:MAG: nuclear transport factor 2 family protein [Gammaproteobacteria bacterium]|nr:nuclear transport factor 2 family protein [Gammaproteobacteria bacterium]